MKNTEIFLTYFVILYVKSRFCFIACGVQLDNGLDPPCCRPPRPTLNKLQYERHE